MGETFAFNFRVANFFNMTYQHNMYNVKKKYKKLHYKGVDRGIVNYDSSN